MKKFIVWWKESDLSFKMAMIFLAFMVLIGLGALALSFIGVIPTSAVGA
jgi:hypothetical protein